MNKNTIAVSNAGRKCILTGRLAGARKMDMP